MKSMKFVKVLSCLALVLTGLVVSAAETAGAPKSLQQIRKEADTAFRQNKLDSALELAALVRSATNATPGDFCWAWKVEADVLARRGRGAEARKMYEQLLTITDPVSTIWAAAKTFTGREEIRSFGYVESYLTQEWKCPLTVGQKIALWDKYAYDGYVQLEPGHIRKGFDKSVELGGRGGPYSGRLVKALQAWEDLEIFPIDEKDVRFPDSIADFGFKMNGRVVRVSKDFGFDPVNSTEFLQKALGSGASRVIIDNVGKPWYTRTLKVPSNVEVVLEKGVRLHTDRSWDEFKKGGIFRISNVSNVVIRGENPNDHEVVVSQFHDLMDRAKNCRDYGRSAFTIENSINVCVKNMRIADTAEDAICFGGMDLNTNQYFENLDLDSCFRQASSFCSLNRGFFRKVRFRNTAGAEPGAGIDLEPAETCQANSSLYLYDCEFENNLGGGLLFSTSSQLPITLHAKRCVFKPHRQADLMVFIRIGPYLGRNKKVPGKAIFEECVFQGYSDVSPIRIDGISLLDLEFKNCAIIDTGRTLARNATPDASAISFWLNRDVNMDGHVEATISFENTRVEGYTNATLVAFRNHAGHESIRNLKGKIDWNGKPTDLSRFKHIGPDNHLKQIEQKLPELTAAQAVKPAKGRVEPDFTFRWGGAWWSPRPVIDYLFFGEKGRSAKLLVRYPGGLWGDLAATVYGPGDVKLDFGEWKKGDNMIEIKFPETGWYRLRPKNDHVLASYEGIVPVYFTGMGEFRDFQLDAPEGKVGYFEVPAQGEVTVKVEEGSVDIRDAGGEIFGTVKCSPRTGAGYLKFKSKSGRNEVWSFAHENRATIKFFAPASGMWADSPEAVPSTVDAVRSPVIRLERKAAADEPGDAAAAADLAGFLKTRPKVAKIVKDEMRRRVEWARKGEWAVLYNKKAEFLEKFRKTVANEQQQKELADEEKNLPPLKELADMEARILKMSPAELERYAFCNVFVVTYGFYHDISFGDPFMRCLYEEADMAAEYSDVYWCIYKKDFENYIRWWVQGVNLGYRDFTLVCDDDKKLDKIIPALMGYVRQITPKEWAGE